MELKNKTTIEARRLDSLARLFEANMTCAAVCIIDRTAISQPMTSMPFLLKQVDKWVT